MLSEYFINYLDLIEFIASSVISRNLNKINGQSVTEWLRNS